MRSRVLIAVAFCICGMQAAAIDISYAYRSPRNPERKVRHSTELIVLHTTEAPARSSINKVSDRGECHYVVTEEGSVYAIIDRDREAFHAGRSMWNGREDVDKYSIGIECVGYHDKPMGAVQIQAIAQLVKELKSMYRIPDERVVCHSHVAYGAPNKWQKRQHRGRKRCGMLFAMASVRRALGLKARPARDNDAQSGRLVVGDAYLQKVLYGNVDTMSAYYGRNPLPVPTSESSSGGWMRRIFGVGKVSSESARPLQGKAVEPKSAVVNKANSKSVPMLKTVARMPTSPAELKSLGYVLKGTISKSRTAVKLAGPKWNAADTYYTIRNKIYAGNAVDPSKLEVGTGVWVKSRPDAFRFPGAK